MICGKTIYFSRNLANEAISGLQVDKRYNRSNKRPSRSYFCDDCQGWHIHTENKIKAVKLKSKQRTQKESNSKPEETRKMERDMKVLVIHNPRKFKVK